MERERECGWVGMYLALLHPPLHRAILPRHPDPVQEPRHEGGPELGHDGAVDAVVNPGDAGKEGGLEHAHIVEDLLDVTLPVPADERGMEGERRESGERVSERERERERERDCMCVRVCVCVCAFTYPTHPPIAMKSSSIMRSKMWARGR